MKKSRYMLQSGTWVAICDGGKALLLENKGSREYPKLETRQAFEQKNPPTHEQGSAPPGRSFNSASGNRSSNEESDFHDQAEKSFLHDFANCVDRCIRDYGVKSLVLVAPARALGMIRPQLSEATRHALVAEVCKDYVKKPLYEIEKLLQS